MQLAVIIYQFKFEDKILFVYTVSENIVYEKEAIHYAHIMTL